MFFGFMSTTELMLLIPAMLLALYANFKVRSTYKKFSEIASVSGLTGAQVANNILRSNQIYNVTVEEVSGELSDHYDPRSKTLRLSSGIYRSNSVAALGIAAHEAGHAIQHNFAYAPLQLRNGIFPVANLGSNMAIPIFIVGLFMNSGFLMDIGIWFFVGAVIFSFFTLPVEFNASGRAIAQLQSGGYLTTEELGLARKVLNAAALTYVAATTVAVMHLIRLLILRNARD
jgi:uncharacterized protein